MSSEEPLPPLQGGTLEASASWIFASDPDRDAFHIIQIETGTIAKTFSLPSGSQPGRVVADDAQVWVTLRALGEIRRYSYDLNWSETAVMSICERIADLAIDFSNRQGWATCLEGELVKFDTANGEVLQSFTLGPDLRDIVIQGTDIFVSKFRAAEVLVLDTSGELKTTLRPQVGAGSVPSVAWRMRAHPQGGVALAHQIARPGSTERPIFVDKNINAYGDSGACRVSVMPSSITHLRLGAAQRGGRPIGNSVLPIDFALDGDFLRPEVAVACAGNRNNRDPGPPALVQTSEATYLTSDPNILGTPVCASSGVRYSDDRQIVSVVYLGDGRLVHQTRDPWQVIIGEDHVVDLPGEVIRDTGHQLFHTDAGGGISCASCHPVGRDDGVTWHFEGDVFSGPRRTPLILGGIEDTAPFHWSGDVDGYEALLHDVFARRMGGNALGDDYAVALGEYVDRIPALKLSPREEEAATRGREIFTDTEVGCTTCHSGTSFTNNTTVDVGTGEAFQVPRLLELRLRAPYMHDGCAETLRQRFTDADCGGGDKHGKTSHLTESELDDLIAYLESI